MRKRLKNPMQVAKDACREGKDDLERFQKLYIDETIGWGVFTKKSIPKGSFLMEYKGELINTKEAEKREKKYEEQHLGSFLFYFGKSLCIDATRDNGSLGRLVNDGTGHSENAVMKIVKVGEIPRLCLFAKRDISLAEEIRYDYGVDDLPWREGKKSSANAFQKLNTQRGESNCQDSDTQSNEVDSNVCLAHIESHPPHIAEMGRAEKTACSDGATSKDSTVERVHLKTASSADVVKVKQFNANPSQMVDTQRGKSNCQDDGTQDEVDSNGCLADIESHPPHVAEMGHAEKRTLDDGATSEVSTMEQASVKLTRSADAVKVKQSNANPSQMVDTQRGKSNCQDGDTQDEVDSNGCLADIESHPPHVAEMGHAEKRTLDDGATSEVSTMEQASVKLTSSADAVKVKQSNANPSQNVDTQRGKSNCQDDGIQDEVDSNGCLADIESHPPHVAEMGHAEKRTLNDDATWEVSTMEQASVKLTRSADAVKVKQSNANPSQKVDTQRGKSNCQDDGTQDEVDSNGCLADIESHPPHVAEMSHAEKTTLNDGATSEVSTLEQAPVKITSSADAFNVSTTNVPSTSSSTSWKLPPNLGDCVLDSDSDSEASYVIPLQIEHSKIPSGYKHLKFPDSVPLADMSSSSDSDESDGSNWSNASSFEDSGNESESSVEEPSHSSKQRKSQPSGEVQDSAVSSSSSRIKVLKTNNEGGRKWDKYHNCIYCMQKYAKLPRHLEQMHKEEIEVAEALSFTKGSQKRKQLLTIIRNKGNHVHNKTVIKSGHGKIIPTKRSAHHVSPSQLLPCNLCFGYVVKTELWKHKQRCIMKDKSSNPKMKQHHQAVSSLLLPMSNALSEAFKMKVIGKMSTDKVSFTARNDDLIAKFGERMFTKLGHEQHQHQHISQKMRELSRLLLEIQTVDSEVTNLTECIHPKNFDMVLDAVRVCSGYDPITAIYKTPSLALKLGHSLKRCALILKAEGIKKEDKVLQQQVESFSQLCEIEWSYKVSASALSTMSERRWNKPTMLPLSEDIVKMQSKLSQVMDENKKLLNAANSKTAWQSLAEVTLCKLILFNRRRSGEVQRIKVTDFTERNLDQVNDDVLQSLTSWEQTLCKKLQRIEIKGKRGRGVPILLTTEMVESIDLLTSKRKDIGVCQSNIFLFARPNLESEAPLRGSDCLRKYALKCEAKHPDHLTSTRLRKQIATVSQIVSLKDHELDVLAGFLGHDIRVHREYYRLPQNTLQMAKVARLLLTMEKGTIASLKDKNLSEIEVPLDDPSYKDSSDEEDNGDGDEGENDSNDTQVMEAQEETEELDLNDENGCSSDEDYTLPLKGSVSKKTTPKSTNPGNRKVQTKRKASWSPSETRSVEKFFAKNIQVLRVPRKRECESCIAKNPGLSMKGWKAVKYKVYNIIQRRKK